MICPVKMHGCTAGEGDDESSITQWHQKERRGLPRGECWCSDLAKSTANSPTKERFRQAPRVTHHIAGSLTRLQVFDIVFEPHFMWQFQNANIIGGTLMVKKLENSPIVDEGADDTFGTGEALKACAFDGALLQNQRLRRDFPFPHRVQSTRTISAVPRAEKRFIKAMRMWTSAACRSGSRAMMCSPNALKHRILASTRLRV